MEGPPLGPRGEDITWPDQVAPRGRKASSTRKMKPQTSNLILQSQLHPRLSQAAGVLGGLNVLYYPTLLQAVNVSQFHTCSQSFIKGEGEMIPLLIWP